MAEATVGVADRLRKIRDRHFDCYVDLALTAMESGEGEEWLEVFDAELANIRTALEWGLAAPRSETARFARSLLWYWGARRMYNEGRQVLGRVLRGSDLAPLERADALWAAGSLANDQGDPTAAREHYEAAHRLAVSEADPLRRARAAHGLGWSFYRLSLMGRAVEAFSEARELFATLTLPERADVLRGLGWARGFHEGPDVSLELHREARLLLEDARDPALTSHYLVETSLLVGCGRIQEALALGDKSIEFARTTGRPLSFAWAAKSNAALASGDRELLRRVLDEAIRVARAEQNSTVEANLQRRLATDALAAGEIDLARDALDSGLRLLDAMDALDHNAIGFRAEILVLRAGLAEDEGELDLARELYRQALASYARSSVQSHADALVKVARLHVEHGDDSATHSLEHRALELLERSDGGMGTLVRVDFAVLRAELDEALRLTTDGLAVAAAQMPRDTPGLLWRRAVVLAELGRFGEAVTAADELVASGLGGPVATLERARIRIAVGDGAGGRSDLLQSTNFTGSGWASVQLKLGTTLARLALLEGRGARAAELWAAVVAYRTANGRLAPSLARRFEEPLHELNPPAPAAQDSRAALDGLRALVLEEFAALATP